MLSSAPPPAVGAVYDAESIFNLELLRLDINVSLATDTGKKSGGRASRGLGRCMLRVFVGRGLPEFAVPSAGRFIIQLGEGGLDSLLGPFAISFLCFVVPGVDLQHTL